MKWLDEIEWVKELIKRWINKHMKEWTNEWNSISKKWMDEKWKKIENSIW